MKLRSFSKQYRIKNARSFSTIIHTGKRFHGNVLRIFHTEGLNQYPRIGISIGRKYGNAVQRNKFKRYVRESFRLHQHRFPVIDMIITPVRNPQSPSLPFCEKDFFRFLTTIEK